MELLPEALIPFVEKRLDSSLKGHWQVEVLEKCASIHASGGQVSWDQAALFNVMDRFWGEAFRTVLGKSERAIVNELSDVRNKLSHAAIAPGSNLLEQIFKAHSPCLILIDEWVA